MIINIVTQCGDFEQVVDLNQPVPDRGGRVGVYDFRILGKIRQITVDEKEFFFFGLLDVKERCKVGVISGEHAQNLLRSLRLWTKGNFGNPHPGGTLGGYWRLNIENQHRSNIFYMRPHIISDKLRERIKDKMSMAKIFSVLEKHFHIDFKFNEDTGACLIATPECEI